RSTLTVVTDSAICQACQTSQNARGPKISRSWPSQSHHTWSALLIMRPKDRCCSCRVIDSPPEVVLIDLRILRMLPNLRDRTQTARCRFNVDSKHSTSEQMISSIEPLCDLRCSQQPN